MTKKVAKSVSDPTLSVLHAPWLYAYHQLSSHIQKRFLPYFQDFGVTLQRAGFKISLLSYVSLMFLFAGISFVASLFTTAVVSILVGTPIVLSLIYSLGISILGGLLVFGILYVAPSLLAV